MVPTEPRKIISPQEYLLKKQKLDLLEQQKAIKEGLPHRYLHKFYQWQRDFIDSRNRMCMLTAANQVGKSSVNIIKCIEWATNKELWPFLWHTAPNQFWYMYPNSDTATIEFETKWKLYLPRGAMENHSVYGWKAEYDQKRKIKSLHFNSGVHVYFKTYSQDAQDLQAGTVYAMFTDEELDWSLYPELSARLNATDGYFTMVFTATLAQFELFEAMELRGTRHERFPEAAKWQISLYDCQKYEDGTPSHWTLERINRAIARCSSEAEKQRRIFGRFVFSEGRKYASFSAYEHSRPFTETDYSETKEWLHYAGVDYGSGGASGHPSAISIVAVHPRLRKARLVKAWRGDNIVTTAGDVVMKFEEMIKGMPIMIQTSYDFAAADLGTIAGSRGLAFTKAEKNHIKGEAVLNSLFKHKMLELDSSDDEQAKLIMELSNLRDDTPKTKARDDLIDSLRYALVRVPFDWSWLGGSMEPGKPKAPESEKLEGRAKVYAQQKEEAARKQDEEAMEREMEEWNELYGS